MSDDLFTLNYKRTFELAKAIEAANLPLTWECLSRVTQVDRALFEQMRRAGCKRIFFGIESGDEKVLKEMKKGITPDQARAAVEACVAAGIKAAGFFMVGYLGETIVAATGPRTRRSPSSAPAQRTGRRRVPRCRP